MPPKKLPAIKPSVSQLQSVAWSIKKMKEENGEVKIKRIQEQIEEQQKAIEDAKIQHEQLMASLTQTLEELKHAKDTCTVATPEQINTSIDILCSTHGVKRKEAEELAETIQDPYKPISWLAVASVARVDNESWDNLRPISSLYADDPEKRKKFFETYGKMYLGREMDGEMVRINDMRNNWNLYESTNKKLNIMLQNAAWCQVAKIMQSKLGMTEGEISALCPTKHMRFFFTDGNRTFDWSNCVQWQYDPPKHQVQIHEDRF